MSVQVSPPAAGGPPPGGQAGAGGFAGGIPPQFADRIRNASPEELERIKDRMRQRGMSEQEIEQRLEAVRGGGTQPTPVPR